MSTLNNGVAFVVVLFVAFGSVVPADGQTPSERNAYAGLERAERAMDRDPSTAAIAAVQRTFRAAYDTYERVERRRQSLRSRAAGYRWNNATDAQWAAGARVWAANWMRYLEAVGVDTASFRAYSDLTRRIVSEGASGYEPVDQLWGNYVGSSWVARSIVECAYSNGLCRDLRSNASGNAAAYIRAAQAHMRARNAIVDALFDAATVVQRVATNLPGAADAAQVEEISRALLTGRRHLLATAEASRSSGDPFQSDDPLALSGALTALVGSTETVLGRLFAFQSGAEADRR